METHLEFTGINATNRMLYWNPGKPEELKLVPYPDDMALSLKHREYQSSALGCDTDVQEMNFNDRKRHVFILAAHLIIRDGMDPQKVHEVLLPLDEYRDGCAYDMPLIKR
jgi:hypothetical protein